MYYRNEKYIFVMLLQYLDRIKSYVENTFNLKFWFWLFIVLFYNNITMYITKKQQ